MAKQLSAQHLPRGVRRMGVNYASGVVEVETTDGSFLLARLSDGAASGASEIARSIYDTTRREIVLELRSGGVVTLEVGSPPGDAVDRRGRPVIYLDQCHWITLARHLHAPQKVAPPERKPAAQLVERARAGEIILPLASAHLTETAPEGRWRRHLAETMLELSRGWQMSSPLRVRQHELRRVFARRVSGRGMAEAVSPFTLEEDALFAPRTGRASSDDSPPNFPPPLQDLHRRLTWASAYVETMLEDAAEPDSAGPRLARLWADSHHELAGYMRENRTSPQNAALVANARLFVDMRDELATAAATVGMSPDGLTHWIEQEATDDLAAMPYVGRLRELTFIRLRNPSDAWEKNDLNDVHFLCCAAGYADVVAGEKKTIDHLRRAERRVKPGATLCATLENVVQALQADVAA